MSGNIPAAHAYLGAIVESSDDAILSKDLNGIIQSCNAAGARMFGYSPNELIGQSVRILIPPERQHEEDDILQHIRAGERIDHFETVRLRKDGRPIDISLTVSPVRDGDGRIIGASKIARDITEQKRARAARSYLAAIVESSEDAILSKDLDGIIQSCNAKAEELFGYTAAELVNRSIRVLIPPDRHAEEDEILARIRRGERIEHFETVRLAKDGRFIEVSLSISPIRDRDGRIIGIAKLARDITEQRRIARALDAQREWFRVTLGSIGDAVIASDADGSVTYMNEPAQRLTGWTTNEAIGQPLANVFNIVNEKTRKPVEHPADLVLRTGHVVGLANHTVLIARNGVERPIADSAAPIRDADGRIIGVVLVFRDVTEARRAEEELAEQREWFETTLESIGDAVIATDVNGHVVFMNPIAEHLTGWRLAEARGRSCTGIFNIINENTRRTVQSPVSRVLADGAVVGLANHTVLIAADGTERPIDDSGAPIRSRDGRIVGVVLVFRDVTERRRAELERRDAALERERLLEAERAARADAERANRVKDEFVAMVSHELRTPLNAILGWTQLMVEPGVGADVVTRGLGVIRRNTRLQTQLISDLLDMSRILSGKLRLDIAQIDLRSVVSDAIDTVQHNADDKRIAIRRELDNAAGLIAGDPGRIQQIVWNLLSNAIKFTAEGGQITVRLRKSGLDAEIAVTDTGVGIRPEFLPQLFDRFHQADQSITRRFGGLGLGLSIVKHLAELHGGTVRAHSAGIGQGATFTVVLPSSIAAVVDAPLNVVPRDSVQPHDSLRGIRILVVEDERDTCEFLDRFLTGHGAQVVIARSAAQALALIDDKVDMIVGDIGLPDVDGYDLMRRIRKLPANAGGAMPAIALTAYARTEDRTRAFNAGFQAHLAKPIEPAELVATISSFAGLIEARRHARDAQT
ncbi:MAG TPA: PAS domain S-box protein [Vicinamibacterales bacterium]